ncbi:hypothetical protein HaLaN_21758, partial [Haematococcus lacustris]
GPAAASLLQGGSASPGQPALSPSDLEQLAPLCR